MSMSKKEFKKFAISFGKKEKVLNYASNNYQLTRPNKVDAVMALIRDCQPNSLHDWENFYFEKAYTKNKAKIKITREMLDELGERLYAKITEIVIPEWIAAFEDLTLQDCKDYIYEVTIVRTYDGFLREKFIINNVLTKLFPEIVFEETSPELDHSGDIDYIGIVGNNAFGIQIKPITATSNFGNYNITERMRASFQDFESQYGGKVFIVFSDNETIRNQDVLEDIRKEIERLNNAI